MPKNSSAKYYQNKKERPQNMSREKYDSLSEEKREKKSDNMCVNDIKLSLKIKKIYRV